jgi:hypothetical protein
MTFDFQLNEDDFVEAQRNHLRKQYGKIRMVPLIGFSLLVVLGVIGGISWLIDQKSGAAMQMAPLALFITIFGSIVLWPWLGISFRRQFRKIRALQLPIHLDADENGILYTNGNGQSKSSWEALEDWREAKGCFMLYTQPNLFFVLPKRSMEPQQILAFRELVSSKVRKP